MTSHDDHLNQLGRTQWDQKAVFWDTLHGQEGNMFHRTLVSPAVERLLELKSGETVLDIGCGNGALARKMDLLGGKVTAVDFSTELIRLAQARGPASIRYGLVDATNEEAITALGSFDAIVCTMAIMDMPVIKPLFNAVAKMLHPAGRMVFATAHPAFNSSNPTIVAELMDKGGEIVIEHSLRISAYLDIPPKKAAGAPGEPNSHLYYHRPMSEILGAAFDAGLVLDGLVEAAFSEEMSDEKSLRAWVNTPQIPPVMAGRLRVR